MQTSDIIQPDAFIWWISKETRHNWVTFSTYVAWMNGAGSYYIL